MLHKARLALYAPLWWILRRSSQAAALERDLVRALMPDRPPETVPPAASLGAWAILGSLSQRQVRSVAYARLYFGRGWERVVAKLFQRVMPGLRDFELNCADIGPGLVIGHGYGSVVWASQIGSDCTVHQGVTLGYSNTPWTTKKPSSTELPVLGDGVWVAPGATVLGGVHIGTGAVVAAHAVVTRDVPGGCLAVGVPAKLVDLSPVDPRVPTIDATSLADRRAGDSLA